MIWDSVSFAYSQLMKVRTEIYRKNLLPGLLPVERAGCPVISVGNITLGGTGKTPVVSHLLSWFSEKNIKPGVVSRGYKGRYCGVVSVKPGHTELFGDEPTMLKGFHRNVPIYLAKKRIEACRELVQKEWVDVIVADDAFQHRGLYRDVDIVVMDALEPLENYKVIPSGRARESLEALQYADYIILNKVNLSSHDSVKALLDLIREYTPCPVVSSEYVSRGIKPLGLSFSGGEVLGKGSQENKEKGKWNKKALLLSGIGNPESFEKLVVGEGIKVREHLKYPDHHRFTKSDIDRALCRLKSLDAERVIVTDKDAVKISMLADIWGPIWSLELQMRFDPSWYHIREEILEKICLGSL